METIALHTPDLIWKIMDELSYDDLLKLCSVSGPLSVYCDDPEYWDHRLRTHANINARFGDPRRAYDLIYRCFGGRIDFNTVLQLDKCVKMAAKQHHDEMVDFLVDYLLINDLSFLASEVAESLGLTNDSALIEALEAKYPHFDKTLAFVGAAEGGHQDLAKKLLQTGEVDLDKAVFDAVKDNNLDRVVALGRTGFVNQDMTNRALSEASKMGNMDMAILLVELGATNLGWSLILATRSGNKDLVVELLKRMMPEDRQFFIDRAFNSSIRSGYMNIASLLGNYGAGVTLDTIAAAIDSGNEQLAIRLLDGLTFETVSDADLRILARRAEGKGMDNLAGRLVGLADQWSAGLLWQGMV